MRHCNNTEVWKSYCSENTRIQNALNVVCLRSFSFSFSHFAYDRNCRGRPVPANNCIVHCIQLPDLKKLLVVLFRLYQYFYSGE